MEKMLDKYELRSEYDQMVSHFVEAGVGRKFKNWNTGKLRVRPLPGVFLSCITTHGVL